MSTFYGTNMTSIVSSPPSDGTKLDASQVGVKVRCFIEQVDLETNDIDDADTVFVGQLPANSRLLYIDIIANGSSDLSAADASAGDGTDADRFAALTDLPAAGKSVRLDAPAVSFAGSEVTAVTNVVLTIDAADLPNASGDGFTAITYYADLN